MTPRKCVLAIFVLSVALILRAGAASRDAVPPPPAAATLLVLPFENAGRDPQLDWLGEGLAELCIERLAGEGRWVFPRGEWLAAVEKLGLPPRGLGATRFTRATMLKIAREMDADHVVYGDYASDGRALKITARVLRVSPATLSPVLTESGDLQDLLDVQARLAWRVLRWVDRSITSDQRAFAGQFAGRRLDAFESYIRGLLAPEQERMSYFREAARLEPDWPEPAYAIGQAYFDARNCEAALTWFSRIVTEHRHGLEARFFAGVCHLLRNDPVRAEAAFSAALELAARPGANGRGRTPALTASGAGPAPEAPRLPEALNNLALAESRQGKWREAAEHWQRAQQLDPEEEDYWFNFGLGGLRAGDYASAVRAFREVLRRNANDTEARALLVGTLERAGRVTEAAVERESCEGTDCSASPTVRALLSATTSDRGSTDTFSRLERIMMALEAPSRPPGRMANSNAPESRGNGKRGGPK